VARLPPLLVAPEPFVKLFGSDTGAAGGGIAAGFGDGSVGPLPAGFGRRRPLEANGTRSKTRHT
jgi:hypothetical protein